MTSELLNKIEKFKAATGLSDHRVGIVLARDGRLLERLRSGGRVWPEKMDEIVASIDVEMSRRFPPSKGAA